MAVVSFDDELFDEEFVSEVKGAFKTGVDLLVESLNVENQKIESLQSDLDRSRKRRSTLTNLIRSIDKDAAPSLYSNRKNGNGRGRKKGSKDLSNSARQVRTREVKEKLTVWLQEHRDELNANGGFRAIDVKNREDFDVDLGGEHKALLNKYLERLHADKVLHFDRWVRGQDYPHRPAGKFYKVV